MVLRCPSKLQNVLGECFHLSFHGRYSLLVFALSRTYYCLRRFSTAGRPHKAADTLADRNVITRLFYGCYPFFAYCCVGTELFYVALYVLAFVPEAGLELTDRVTITLHAVSFGVKALSTLGKGKCKYASEHVISASKQHELCKGSRACALSPSHFAASVLYW